MVAFIIVSLIRNAATESSKDLGAPVKGEQYGLDE
jgi:hypothetical protein